MPKNIIVWDLICYIAFPLAIWNFGRDIVGDYYAMLISSMPGIIYTVVRFYITKAINFFGVFMISTLVVGTLIDVLAGSAIQLLWNNVYYAYALGLLTLFSIVIKKPIFLYFFLDFAVMQGYDRQESKKLFYRPKIYFVFCLITIAFAFRDILLATIRVWFIKEYGVEAFDKGIIVRQALAWTISGLCVFGYIRILKLIKEYTKPKILAEQ